MATRIVLEEGETSVLRARMGRRVTCWQLSDPEAGPRAEGEADTPPAGYLRNMKTKEINRM